MEISYKKLWKLLIDHDLTKSQLRDKARLGTSTIAKLGKNEYVAMDVLVRICNVFHCQIGDIVEINYPDFDSVRSAGIDKRG